MKKGRHRRFEEARSLKRSTATANKRCPECGAEPDDEHASWCMAETTSSRTSSGTARARRPARTTRWPSDRHRPCPGRDVGVAQRRASPDGGVGEPHRDRRRRRGCVRRAPLPVAPTTAGAPRCGVADAVRRAAAGVDPVPRRGPGDTAPGACRSSCPPWRRARARAPRRRARSPRTPRVTRCTTSGTRTRLRPSRAGPTAG